MPAQENEFTLMAETVLALDLGTKTGWAVGDPTGITAGTWDLKPRRYDSPAMRYVKFTARLNEIAGAYPITRIVFEEVRRHLGTTAAHVWGAFQAQMAIWADARKIPYEGLGVGEIKKHATGKGNANKGAMIEACRSRLGVEPEDDNEADARWMLALAVGWDGGE